MRYELYLCGKKLKHYILLALNELIETGGSQIRGCHGGYLVPKWLVYKGFVVQTLTTPPNYWKVEYEYAVTNAGRAYADEQMPYMPSPE